MSKPHNRKKGFKYANDNFLVNLDDVGGRNDKKKMLCSGFLIRKALYKVRICSEYDVMPRLIRRNAYQQVSKNS